MTIIEGRAALRRALAHAVTEPDTGLPAAPLGRRGFCRSLAWAAALAAPGAAWPQAGGGRPTKIVVPFGPGGAPDIIARLLAGALAARSHQPYVVENKAGANGVIGTDAVAKAAPDGFTLLLHGPSVAINPSMHRKLPFDTAQDLTPITNVCTTEGMLFVVNAHHPARSLGEFVAGARKAAVPPAYASPGIGNAFHLAAERFLGAAGLSATHVPFKSASEAVASLLAQETQFMIASAPSVVAVLKSNQLRALAITSAQTSPQFPEVPTMAQAGFPALEMNLWYGLFGPKGLPPARALQIAESVRRELAEPAFTLSLAQQSLLPVGSSPEHFARFVLAEIEVYRSLVKRAGIVPE